MIEDKPHDARVVWAVMLNAYLAARLTFIQRAGRVSMVDSIWMPTTLG